jgi:hypothetical protein
MPLRRDFLAFTAGAVVAKPGLPAPARAENKCSTRTDTPPNPDTALLASIARFVTAEHRINALCDKGSLHYVEDEGERGEVQEPFKVEQKELLPLICRTRAVTHEATVAKARMLHLWASDVAQGLGSPDWVDQMLAGIMLDLLPEGATDV